MYFKKKQFYLKGNFGITSNLTRHINVIILNEIVVYMSLIIIYLPNCCSLQKIEIRVF